MIKNIYGLGSKVSHTNSNVCAVIGKKLKSYYFTEGV